MTMGKAIQQLESLFLFVIALLTVVGAVKEMHLILVLLMFLYVEVLGMAGVYSDSKQIPITLPIFIAMAALAR
jgi:protein PsiE